MSLRRALFALLMSTTAAPASADWPRLDAQPSAEATADAVVSGTGLVLTKVSDRQGVTAIVSPPDGTGRLFLAQQPGRIVIVTGPTGATTFLDITSIVDHVNRSAEQGLLGLAFHPNYQFNRLFYVHYTNRSGDVVIARYATSASDATQADPFSAQVLLTIPHRDAPIHNGGQLAFGPDGYLYVAVGDGGVPANAQSPDTLLGKILRLDVDRGLPYTIPSGNPYASGGGRPEIWALGLRNPWRFSFDRANGDLWLADVGQDRWEEINRLLAGTGAGANFGWNHMEGAHCYPASCDPTGMVLPVVEYAHGGSPYACSVTGGFRYRGADIVGLGGAYVFADFCSCGVHVARETTPGSFRMDTLSPTLCGISTFGQDARGELYVASLYDGVYRVDLGTTPRVFVGNVNQYEGRSDTSLFRFSITRFPAPTTPTSFTVSTLDGGSATANSDYVPLANMTVTMPAHQSFADFAVQVVGDIVEEANETFMVTVTGDGTSAVATGAILNDDGRLQLLVREGSENGGTFGFQPYLSRVSDGPVSFNWQTRDGTATAGEDYTASSGSVVIPAGVKWGDPVSIAVSGDELVEPNESVIVDVTDLVGTTGPSSIQLTIVNDDLGPQMTVPPVSVAEGDADHVAEMTVRLSAPSPQTVTVHYATDDAGSSGRATPDADYVPTSGDLTFPPGTTELKVPIQIRGDVLDEFDEQLLVRLTNVVNARVPPSTFLTIEDDDARPSLLIDDVTVAEGTGGTHEVEVAYRLSAASGIHVSVTPTFVDGTAVGRSSSTATRFNILQPEGQPAAPYPGILDFGVPTGSRVDRLELSFWNWTASRPVDLDLLLAAPDGRSIVLMSDVGGTSPVTFSGGFRDDYRQLAPDRTLSGGSPTNYDDGPDTWPDAPAGPRITSMAEFRGADASGQWKLYVVNDGSSSSSLYHLEARLQLRADYASETWAADSLPPGQITGRLRLQIVDDREVEGPETFQVCLGALFATSGCGTITVADDDAQSLWVEPGVGSEWRQFARIPVRLAAPANGDVSLTWTASSGTATAGADFPTTSGSLVVPAGRVDAYFDVPVADDAIWEPAETFTVHVASTDVAVSVADAPVEVNDNDSVPVITIGPATAPEGSRMRFPVTLTGVTERPASVEWRTEDSSAWAGSDYVATSGTVTLPPGTTTGWIEVPTLHDDVPEGDERFDVVVTRNWNATVASLRAKGTLTNFTIPGPPRIAFAGDPSAPEDGGAMTFTVSLSWPWKTRVRMRATTVDGSALATSDYATTTQIVAFEPGETEKTVTVPLLPDAVDELDKTFSLVLSRVTGGVLADGAAVGRIVDDDPAPPGSPTVSIGDGRVVEGPRLTSTSMYFTVSLSAPATRPTSVSYSTGGGTATAGTDYVAKVASVAFRVGERSKTVFVKVKGDRAVEPDETVVLTLTSAANAFLGDAEGVGTIVDDDP